MQKSRYNAPRITTRPIHPADQAKGDEGERRFQNWLDASRLPHVYLDQTPMSVPDHLRGEMKRPDYVVGVPGVGAVAFDVKVKSLYNGHFIFELNEIRRMRTFARFFHWTVYFACLDPDGSPESYWIRLDQFDNLTVARRGASLTLAIPAEDAMPVSMRKSFHDAFLDAVRLA
nr:hypothetical protein [Methylobacterium sp. L1A1]